MPQGCFPIFFYAYSDLFRGEKQYSGAIEQFWVWAPKVIYSVNATKVNVISEKFVVLWTTGEIIKVKSHPLILSASIFIHKK